MKKFNLTKIIASSLIAVSLLALNPIGASAEWKKDSHGWWFSEDSSWATGWKKIDGKWYYFYYNGYMAHDTTIGGYKLGSNGAWLTTTTGSTNTEANTILTDAEYFKKLTNIYTRLDAVGTSINDDFQKEVKNNPKVISDTLKQSIANKKIEMDEIYKEVCSLNPNDNFKEINNSLVKMIKLYDDGMALLSEGVNKNDLTKMDEALKLLNQGDAENKNLIQLVKELQAKFKNK